MERKKKRPEDVLEHCKRMLRRRGNEDEREREKERRREREKKRER